MESYRHGCIHGSGAPVQHALHKRCCCMPGGHLLGKASGQAPWSASGQACHPGSIMVLQMMRPVGWGCGWLPERTHRTAVCSVLHG
jgi:hypothetical protein